MLSDLRSEQCIYGLFICFSIKTAHLSKSLSFPLPLSLSISVSLNVSLCLSLLSLFPLLSLPMPLPHFDILCSPANNDIFCSRREGSHRPGSVLGGTCLCRRHVLGSAFVRNHERVFTFPFLSFFLMGHSLNLSPLYLLWNRGWIWNAVFHSLHFLLIVRIMCVYISMYVFMCVRVWVRISYICVYMGVYYLAFFVCFVYLGLYH